MREAGSGGGLSSLLASLFMPNVLMLLSPSQKWDPQLLTGVFLLFFFPLPPNPPFFLCLHQDVLPVHIPYASLVLHVATFCYLDTSYEHMSILFSPLVVVSLTFSVKCLYIP